MTAVKQGGNTLASFTYNGAGKRASKLAGGVTTNYVYDGIEIAEERLSSGGTIRYWYGDGIDDVLAKQDTTGVVSYYAKDHLGSVTQETNSAGVTTLTRQYDPWGNLLAGASTPGYAFTGREWDSESNLYYYRARYYNSKVGRFASEDPVGLRGGVNFYAYVKNRPTVLRDPRGLFADYNMPPGRPLCQFYGNCPPPCPPDPPPGPASPATQCVAQYAACMAQADLLLWFVMRPLCTAACFPLKFLFGWGKCVVACFAAQQAIYTVLVQGCEADLAQCMAAAR